MPEYSVAKPGDELGLGLRAGRTACGCPRRAPTTKKHEERDERERVREEVPRPRRAQPCAADDVLHASEPGDACTIGKIERPAGISYEMICAAERMPPSSDHLLFDAQPAIRMPTTTSAVTDVT